MRDWLLIADAGRARIFSVGEEIKQTRLLWQLENPRGRARPQQLTSDRCGRLRKGSGVRSAMDYRTSPHATEARRFARRVISVLRDGRDHHAYNSVAIAAPARFLGLLRSMLNPKERRHLRLHVPRDFTRVTGRSLEARVQKLLGQSG